MVAERRGRHPSLPLLRARGFTLGFGAGIIPAIIMLAGLAGVVPIAAFLPTTAAAYTVYFISLPLAAVQFRHKLRPSTVGFALGVVVPSGVVILEVIVAAAHAAAGG
ncbi:MAG TPA: hypothetical protein VE258_17605 [Ktedonobacterales bacterium]|nr:hypothetical protein [Ktedonobacterales bacterium]